MIVLFKVQASEGSPYFFHNGTKLRGGEILVLLSTCQTMEILIGWQWKRDGQSMSTAIGYE